jgi:response regulator RpfG family c-di-GMP phosphodiesterase
MKRINAMFTHVGALPEGEKNHVLQEADGPNVDADDEASWLIDDEPEPVGAAARPEDRPFRILIADDDDDVHTATRFALRTITFKGRALELISAYSGDEAFAVLSENPDIAMILLDVVMETDDAGLRLVGRIRNELHNDLLRIVLRTGQPGQAPEQHVIVDYDINDYKAKSELTTQKLFTTVVSSLRAYEGLMIIHRSRIGLARILDGATNLYKIHSLREFASGVLNQISAILDVGADGVLCVLKSSVSGEGGLQPTIVASTGRYAALDNNEFLPPDHFLADAIHRAFREKCNQSEQSIDVLFVQTQHEHEFAVSITPPWPLTGLQHQLLGVFCSRIGAAFDNLYLFDQVQKAQSATVIALADLAEFRDEGTGGHVRRVQRLTEGIAGRMHQRGAYPRELTPQLLELIGVASVLHDVGKVSTPDHILLKPGVHTPEERFVMQSHALIGAKILQRAADLVGDFSYLAIGAQIAGGHHEHFDGGGYPRGARGTDIPLAARIVAVVDVFDALLHRRSYKEPWSFNAAVDYVRQRRGGQFDPEVVDALFDYLKTEPHDWMSSGD